MLLYLHLRLMRKTSHCSLHVSYHCDELALAIGREEYTRGWLTSRSRRHTLPLSEHRHGKEL
jgi:hypothetical protein